MNEIFKLTSFYVKKLFGIKNIVFFLIIFLCLYTLFYTFQLINDFSNQNTGLDEIANVLRDTWLIKILFIGIFINFVSSYSYIYLKKNNYTNTTNLKNSFCNSFIVFTMVFICYLVISFFIFLDYSSYNVVHSFGYNQNMKLLIDTLFFNLIILMFISLFNVKNKHGFLYVSVVFIMSLVFFFNILARALWMIEEPLNTFYVHILIVESVILFILMVANFIKRTPKIRSKFHITQR